MDICPFLLPQFILIITQIILLCTTLVETAMYHQLCKLMLQLLLGKSLVLRDLMTDISKVIIHMVMTQVHIICSLSAEAFSSHPEIWAELSAESTAHP